MKISIPKTTHTPQNLCLYIYIIKYCNENFLTLYKILLKNARGGNNEDFLTRRFSQWKWFPGIYRDRPTWGNLEFYKTQMETPIFLLISSRRKLIIHGIFFFKSYELYEENFTQKKVFTFQQNPDWKLENIIEIAERIQI